MNRNLNLLLVEDNPGDADWIRERLSEVSDYDFRVSHVATVRDASAALQRGNVDAILLDLNLPDSRGVETLDWARRVADEVAVTVLTGTDDEDLRLFAYNEGAQDYIVKGGTQAKLLSRIISFGIDRHRAKLQQQQLEKIVAAIPDAVLVLDEGGMVHFVNDAAMELFAKSREEFAKERLGLFAQEGRISEIEILHPDGKRHGEVSVVPFDLHDRQMFLAAVRDVTEKKKLTERLRETQKLEAIGTLAGGIAHDFNNLLTMIAGNLNLALEEKEMSTTMRECLEEIDSAANRATDLVRQILTFSRRQETELKIVPAETAVTDAVRFLRATIPDRIALQMQMDSNLPSIRADLTQIQQVIMNLGTNAVHAMPHGPGRLTITAGLRDFAEESEDRPVELPPGRYVKVSVEDTGIGMDRGTMERIFEPFYTSKAKGEGTGLGLAVVHGIVRNHGGAITVSSESGQGSVFHVFLPATDEKEEARPAESPSESRGQGQHVLFVDDERQLVSLAQRVLGRLNFRVSAYEDPREALEAFRAQPEAFDVVITDLSMPHLDGPDLIREIRKLRSEIPIVLATGFLESEGGDAMRSLGVNEVVVKPGGLTNLGELLHRVLEPSSER